MKKRLFIAMLLMLLAAVATGPSGARQATAATAPNINLALNLALLNAIPPPADNAMLDANGNVVLDPSGNPVSDPAEQFHAVIPHDFDPGHTNLVEAGWLDGLGCVTNGFTATPNADFSAWSGNTAPYSEPACPSGDSKDAHNEGLLLVKTGPSSANFASAEASLKKVKGLTLGELGYDIRKAGMIGSAQGSHCGAGAPRFDIQTTDAFFFIGCASPPPTTEFSPALTPPAMDPWDRLRWGNATPGSVLGFCVVPTPTAGCPFNFDLVPVTGTVQRIDIVFDEGTDTGSDFFGAAIIDNIDVNGTLVGRGGM